MRPDADRYGFGGDDPGFGDDAHEAGNGRDPERARAAEVIAEKVRGARPAEIPGRLCAVAVRLLPVAGASVSLRSEGLPVRIGASGDRASHLAELQATLGDGPSLSASDAGAPVLACDLTGGRDRQRWPVFAHQVAALGVGAVYSVPLGNGAVCVGTLDLYRDTPGALTERQLWTARLVAGVMTVALVALPREENDGREAEQWLSGLATDHDGIYQAIGMIMAQLGIDADEALARLRAHAFAHDRTVLEVARDVVAHRRRFDGDGSGGGEPGGGEPGGGGLGGH